MCLVPFAIRLFLLKEFSQFGNKLGVSLGFGPLLGLFLNLLYIYNIHQAFLGGLTPFHTGGYLVLKNGVAALALGLLLITKHLHHPAALGASPLYDGGGGGLKTAWASDLSHNLSSANLF